MMRILLLVILLPFFSLNTAKKEYLKEHYPNGQLKAEGWLMNNSKSGYWKYYFKNGSIARRGHYEQGAKNNYWHYYYNEGGLQKEGHYQDGSPVQWWIYYDKKGQLIHKCQLKDGVKNGYCLKYTNQKLTSAQKYRNGKKIDEWFSFTSFKKDNKLSDLK